MMPQNRDATNGQPQRQNRQQEFISFAAVAPSAQQQPDYHQSLFALTGSEVMTNNSNLHRHVPKDVLLPEEYTPGSYTVICGRGKENFHHPGNRRFRRLLNMHRDAYMGAKNRSQKSMLVLDLVHQIRTEYQNAENRADGIGAFVRRDRMTGRWYDVGDSSARDKVGHSLRDPERTKEIGKFSQQSSSGSLPPSPTTGQKEVLRRPSGLTCEYVEQHRQALLSAMTLRPEGMSAAFPQRHARGRDRNEEKASTICTHPEGSSATLDPFWESDDELILADLDLDNVNPFSTGDEGHHRR